MQNSKPSDKNENLAEWNHDDIGGLREKLTGQIVELSEKWKIERALKEEQRKKEVAEGKEVEGDESSDSDIDIVEDVVAKVSPPKGKKAAVVGGKKAGRIRG